MNDRTAAGRLGLAISLALAAMLPSSRAFAGQRTVSNVHAADLAETARSLPRGAELRIEGASLDEFSGSTGLDLERFDVVTPNAKFVVQTDKGPKELHPDVPAYYRGHVDGMRGSIAVLSVKKNGEIRGIVSGAEGTWLLGRKSGGPNGLDSRKVKKRPGDPAASFKCELLDNPSPRRTGARAAAAASGSSTASTMSGDPQISALPLAYTAQIAVELDYDFYQIFLDSGDAIGYALDLMAFTGSLGESELGMNVQVPFIQLWATEADPYSGGAVPRLEQLRTRWNAAGSTNCAGGDCTLIPRSTVILMSQATGGGVAYVPGLCDWYHSTTNGFSYAFAGAMNGNFDIDNPGVVWDVVAATHELGHNFGSPHTHCYDPPVDECYGAEAGCYSGPTSLPSGCTGPGDGCATLMGYCHLLNGGLGNVSLTYGAGHPYGDAPQRVPDLMIDTIADEAASTPACLTVTNGMRVLEVSKNGTGTGTVTSSPAGIDCGSVCRTYFDADTVVTLTPTPSAFSDFAGWTGDPDCNDGVVTLANAASCVATFNGSCGLLNQDCEDHNPCTVDSCPGDIACVNSGTPRDASTCFEAPLAKFKVTNDPDPSRSKLQWQWNKGDAFDQGDLGDPSADTDYALCVYDSTAGSTSLATSLSLPGGTAGWSNRDPSGWKFSDSSGSADGYRKIDIRTGIAGKARIKLKAGGAVLPLSAPFSGSEYYNQDPSVIVQFISSEGSCWTSEFAAGDTSRNAPSAFNASSH